MSTTIVNRTRPSIAPSEHPYMTGAWTPQYDEVDATEMKVIGDIPADLDGIYVRNTENPVHDAIGVYHPFDGDGMLHSMSFRDGQATYRNRFVRTEGFLAEQEAGHSLWTGLIGNPENAPTGLGCSRRNEGRVINRCRRARRRDPLNSLHVRRGLPL